MTKLAFDDLGCGKKSERTARPGSSSSSSADAGRLGLPVGERSYLLFHITTAKLPTELKTRFEQRYGSDPRMLPTFDQLMKFLEEKCRLFDNIPRDVGESSGNTGRRVTP
ncbi:hypothetical protein EVAR_19184_1 [Eumeta japonica]|uniref:Uncharacterized protein n=1 Tax=Eumeta variegata TaxID=151549 RepID=A0A4C1VQH8_EUMVA|nr:hypothetical protein EVAR_19184_1 [Eumeta japonica]